MSVLDTMVDTLDRLGKAAGAGFYDYLDGGKKHLWPGLYEHFVVVGAEIPLTDMQERMLFIMSLETVRCLAEGVLRTVPDANIGSIMGIGFPPLYGGALQYINGYAGGVVGFTARAKELAQTYGERFAPPALLRDKAAAGEPFA